MKYCTNCGSEYLDSVARCADCANSELVAAPEPGRRTAPPTGEMDTRRFARAGTAEDPLTAEHFANAVRGAGIPVFSRQRLGGTVGRLTGGSSPWWEILVPEDAAERAAEVIERERAALLANEDEAIRAAEEESLEETLVRPSELEPAGVKPS